jgi:hypothetical protein
VKKWKYPDPKIKSENEKWYENIPEDEELENYIYALINRHSVQANSRGLSFQKDAALVPLLMKLVYIWKKT